MAEGEAPTATPESAAVAPIESAPLDARKPEVAAEAGAARPKRKTVGQTPAPAAEAATAVEAAPAVTSGPARPIQVASFSKEDNAKRAAEALAKIGITATPQKSEKDGKAVWGVVVQGDEATLKKIKDAGFADAYFLK
ncbi:MAG: SPOR domain-containing protein [Pseudomonadota bacterium]